jgi:hypothetical protein
MTQIQETSDIKEEAGWILKYKDRAIEAYAVNRSKAT